MADLFPTICELCGAELPPGVSIDGVSFAGRLLDGTPSPRKWVTGGIRGQMSLFDGSYRLNLKSQQVIDARDLPRETVVANPEGDAAERIARLKESAERVLAKGGMETSER